MMKEVLISFMLPFILAVCCFIFATWLLPKNCTLLVLNVPGPQMCHTIPLPEGCFDSYCRDVRTEYIASIIAGFGVCLICVPFAVHTIRESRNRSVVRIRIFE
jgi:hypothetical protein